MTNRWFSFVGRPSSFVIFFTKGGITVDKKTYWQKQLAQSRAGLNELLDTLSEEQWQTTVFSEDQSWTVQNVVTHLVESEMGMSIHIHKIRKGRETLPKGFKIDDWNAGLTDRMGDTTPEELRQKLGPVRERTLQGMETLSDDEWSLTGVHPTRGTITIEQYYETISGHETSHTNDIKQAIANQE